MGAVIRTIDNARQDYAYVDIVKAIKNGNRSLDLTYRNLRNVPKLLSSLRDIVELQLSFNLLTQLPNSIGSMHKLAILRVNNCALESLVRGSQSSSLYSYIQTSIPLTRSTYLHTNDNNHHDRISRIH